MDFKTEIIREAFEHGRLVAMPTETVYGLAAPINRPDLVERIFELKRRPKNDPLIVHISSIAMAQTVFEGWGSDLQALAEKFWPGPFTIVSNKSDLISDDITAGELTVAVRMPNHPMALKIIEAAKCPLVAPSANPFTKLSPTKAEHVREYFGDEDVLVIDGGECQRGIESTIIWIDPAEKKWKLLRSGPTKIGEIKKVLRDYELLENVGQIPLTPGSHHTHYQPKVPFYLIEEGEQVDFPGVTKELKLPNDYQLAEAMLYGQLHELAKQADQIIYRVIPERFLDPNWNAIRDRLKRAASKKS